MKSKWLMFFIAAVFFVLVSGCGFEDNNADANNNNGDNNGDAETNGNENNSDETEGDGTATLYVEDEIPTVDSSLAHDDNGLSAINNINEGLYRADENHEPQEALVEDHETNDDETVHTFTIRDDTEWSNGDPVTADDFEYAWKRTFEEAGNYTDMFVTANVENAEEIIDEEKDPEDLGVEATDDDTLEVTLEEPSPLFKQLMTFPVFFPQNEDFVEEQDADSYGTEADKVLENGPYVLDSWDHDEGWTFKKNPDYWDADNVDMDEIEMLVVKDNSTGLNLWETEELDYAQISSSYVDEYEDDDAFQLDERASIKFMRVNHNMDEFQNENIRKAFDMTIDKEGLTDTILKDGSIPLNAFVPKEFSFSPDDEEDFRDLNGDFNEGSEDEAQELWDEGLSDLDEDEVEIELTTSDDEDHEKVAEYVQDELEENLDGLTVDIDKVPLEERLDKENDVDYDMVLSTWSPDYSDPMTFLDMWTSDSSANRMDYSDEEYDDIISDARVETDETKRYDMLLDAEEMLMEDVQIIPLYQDSEALLKRTNIKDMLRHPSAPQYDYKYMHIE